MIVRWEAGRETVDRLIRDGSLQCVPPNRDLADEYIVQAKAHLATSRVANESDPVGSFQLAYNSGRKTIASILINQGLRQAATPSRRRMLSKP